MKFSLLLFFALLGTTAFPQSQPATPPVDGGVRERIISVTVPTTAHMPFTAYIDTDWTRQLSDGTTISVRNHRTVARDSSGRVFQERRALTPDGDRQPTRVTEFDILDPVAHTRYICIPNERVCHASPFSGIAQARFADTQGTVTTGQEHLGSKLIDGFEVNGILERGIIETGAIGNDTPIAVTRESWYSPQLGFNLSTKRSDPRFGTQTFEVSSIVAGKPDKKLFEIPGNYEVVREFAPPPGYFPR